MGGQWKVHCIHPFAFHGQRRIGMPSER